LTIFSGVVYWGKERFIMYGQNVKELIGKTIIDIKNNNDEELIFTCDDGSVYMMYHSQDCCEGVSIDEIIGDLSSLLNTPLIKAEERTSDKNPDGITKEYQDSFTWTFYELATIKGYVTLRWYGESNGYYSESVDFKQIEKANNTVYEASLSDATIERLTLIEMSKLIFDNAKDRESRTFSERVYKYLLKI
jgi:hypothetical protein